MTHGSNIFIQKEIPRNENSWLGERKLPDLGEEQKEERIGERLFRRERKAYLSFNPPKDSSLGEKNIDFSRLFPFFGMLYGSRTIHHVRLPPPSVVEEPSSTKEWGSGLVPYLISDSDHTHWNSFLPTDETGRRTATADTSTSPSAGTETDDLERETSDPGLRTSLFRFELWNE